MIIVEGYEMTGKSTLIEKLKKEDKGYICWKDIAKGFGINSSTGDYGVGYTGSWIIGATVAHLGVLGVNTSKVVLDRGILSSMVYGEIKDGFKGEHLTRYLEDLNETYATIVVCEHENKDTAKCIFERSKSERAGKEDEYDDKNFEDYWNNYMTFMEKFDEKIDYIKRNYPNIKIHRYVIKLSEESDEQVKNTVFHKLTSQNLISSVDKIRACTNVKFVDASPTHYCLVTESGGVIHPRSLSPKILQLPAVSLEVCYSDESRSGIILREKIESLHCNIGFLTSKDGKTFLGFHNCKKK